MNSELRRIAFVKTSLLSEWNWWGFHREYLSLSPLPDHLLQWTRLHINANSNFSSHLRLFFPHRNEPIMRWCNYHDWNILWRFDWKSINNLSPISVFQSMYRRWRKLIFIKIISPPEPPFWWFDQWAIRDVIIAKKSNDSLIVVNDFIIINNSSRLIMFW